MVKILGYCYLAILACLIVGFITMTRKRKSILTKNNYVGFAVASVMMYTLYLTAAFYKGAEVTFFFAFSLIKKVIDTAVFSPDVALIESIARDLLVFRIDFAVTCCLLAFTTISSAITLFGSSVTNRIAYKRKLRRPCDIIIGYSPDGAKYAAKNNDKNCVIFADGISREDFIKAKSNGLVLVRRSFSALSASKGSKNNENHFLIFADAHIDALDAAKKVAAFAKTAACNCNQYLHIEGLDEQIAAIRKTVNCGETKLSILPIDKSGLIAKRFLFENPISLSLRQAGFLEENCSLKNGKRVNVVFIGFGKVSRRLFSTFAVQYQFATEKDGKLTSVPVHYYILDNDKTRTVGTEISRIGYEFDNIISESDFGTLDPLCIVERQEETLDVYSLEAMKLFDSVVSADSYTEFFISLTQTHADFAYAEHLADYLGKRDYKIYVRNPNGIPFATDHADRICSFAEVEDIYTHETIVDETIRILSQEMNKLYDSSNINVGPGEWEALSVFARRSNISSSMSIPFKLGLLGLKFTEKNTESALITRDAYFARYRCNTDTSNTRYLGLSADNVLAFCEHSRWSAFHVFAGYRPMPKRELHVETNDENQLVVIHKDADGKKHACIAPYYNLDALIRCEFKLLNGREPTETDIADESYGPMYHNDFMFMDNLYDIVTRLGYGIQDTKKKDIV